MKVRVVDSYESLYVIFIYEHSLGILSYIYKLSCCFYEIIILYDILLWCS